VARLISSGLYRTSPLDASVFLSVIPTLLIPATGASLLPASEPCELIPYAHCGPLLFGVHSWEPETLFGVAAALGILAVLPAIFLHADAASVDPM
jgi:hypothetical protein